MNTLITFHITEAAEKCSLDQESILQFISEEWITPKDKGRLLFDEDDVCRIQLIAELKNDLGVNNEGIPIILHLVDQLHHLHFKLSSPDSWTRKI